MIIYKITNKLNGKSYIGQTSKTLRTRWNQHCQSNRKRASPLIRDAIAKYGADNFEAVVLEICKTKDELNEREKYWIFAHGTFVPNGYNLTTGGDRVELAEESKRKIAQKLIGRPTGRKGISTGNPAWNKGKPWSIEMRKKLSDAHKRPGYKPRSGWKMSEEVRLKMSLARKGKPLPWLIGRKVSEETRIKMSLRKLGKRISPKTEFKPGEGAKIIRNIDTGEVFISLRAAASKYKCDQSGFSKCANGHIKTVKGYRWEFVDIKKQSTRKNLRSLSTQETAQMLFDFR